MNVEMNGYVPKRKDVKELQVHRKNGVLRKVASAIMKIEKKNKTKLRKKLSWRPAHFIMGVNG